MAAGKAKALDNARLELPPDAARRLGLSPGVSLDVVLRRGRVEIRPDIHSLSRVYIEPTSRCNLSCRTCVQRTWEERQGDMAGAVFQKLLGDLSRFPHLESVMLGGFGEPTAHPDIISMITGLKAGGLSVEMVSNATLLDERLGGQLAESGLDRLWVSFDAVEAEGFENIREGADFKTVCRNLKRLGAAGTNIKIGIAFVVTRSNLRDLARLGDLAREVGADSVSVSNVIPYGPEMEKQMLCGQALSLGTFSSVKGQVDLNLPRLDISVATRETLLRLLTGRENISIMGNALAAGVDECRFVRERCAFIRWDGQVAPCMALMHDHVTHFRGGARRNDRHIVGDLHNRGLREIWDDPGYAAFREKVARFDFSPCHVCGGCEYSGDNRQDCGGNSHPAACGGCLWAQGVIQCP